MLPDPFEEQLDMQALGYNWTINSDYRAKLLVRNEMRLSSCMKALGAHAQKDDSVRLFAQIESRPKDKILRANHQLTRPWCENGGTLLKYIII